MRLAFVLLLFCLLSMATDLNSPTKTVSLPLEITADGNHIIELYVGTPRKLMRFLLDFQSMYSGSWTNQLADSRSYCDGCNPLPRDIFYLGPHVFIMEIVSVPMIVQHARMLGQPPSYFPAPVDPTVSGWLALGRGSEIWKIWNSFTIDRYVLTLSKHLPNKDGKLPFLTHFDRKLPNVPMRITPHSEAWHRGWLVSRVDPEIVDKPAAQKKLATELKWLADHHATNLTFVLFGNKTRSELSQALFDSLFFRANVYNPSTMPARVYLAPGLYMAQADWFIHDPLSGQNQLDISYLPLPLAKAMMNEHPIHGVAPENLVVLSPHAILKRYRVKMSLSTNELSFIQFITQDHLDVAEIYLLLLLVILFSILYSVRMVYLRKSVIKNTLSYRFNVRSQLEVGFRSKGFWILQALQLISIVAVILAFWSSDRMSQLRKNGDSSDAQAIYWVTCIFVNVSLLLEFINFILLMFVGLFYPQNGDEQKIAQDIQKTRARIFVITHGLFIQTLLDRRMDRADGKDVDRLHESGRRAVEHDVDSLRMDAPAGAARSSLASHEQRELATVVLAMVKLQIGTWTADTVVDLRLRCVCDHLVLRMGRVGLLLFGCVAGVSDRQDEHASHVRHHSDDAFTLDRILFDQLWHRARGHQLADEPYCRL